MQDYKSLATEVVAELKKQGIDACDVFIEEASNFNTDVRLGKIEKLEQSISKGMGLRIFKNGATALTYSTDFAEKSIKNLVKDAIDIVKISNSDKYNGLAPREMLGIYGGELRIFDESMTKIPAEKKIELAKEVEDSGLKYDKRVTNSEGSSWNDTISQITLATSDGFVGQYKSTAASLSVSLIAEENGVKQTDYWFSFNRFANRLSPSKEIGEEAARRVTKKLGGKKVKSQSAPVVVDPIVSRRLVRMLFGAASGQSIYRKSSYLMNKVGEQITSPLVTIVDDATMADGPGSRPFDGEGIKSSQVTVIEKGILKSYICDSYSARRLELKPTGNASRSYQSSPFISSTNLYIKAGASDPKDIVKSVKNGLYLTQLFSQGYNSVTGDFSIGAGGFWIENGEITFPAQEITLAGNLLNIFKNITMVGNDLSFRLGGAAAPTLLVSEATIGGA
jgi:PmbA protein